MQPDETAEREERFLILLEANLLTDEDIRAGVSAYLEENGQLPQFSTGACHPSYSPCVPVVEDVDCAGGSKDGPVYAGEVEVVGDDVDELDTDGDGVGCEGSELAVAAELTSDDPGD